jgi:trigger factor
MVLRHVGEGAILEEATEILVNDVYPKAIDEAGIEPYASGSLENIPSLDPPTFEFVIPLKAEVELGDYKAVRLPYEPKETTEEDVERVIADLRERQAVQEPVQRPAQEGDIVYIRLSGERKAVEEGTDPTLVNDRPFPVVIESEDADTENEWPFPGFSRLLIGTSPGDEKTFPHTFSDESAYESLRGVEAEFQVVVEDVKSRTLPELNDEFAQSVGEYASLEELRAKIKEDLHNHELEHYNEDYDQQVLDEITQVSTIKYPQQMLEREIDNVIESLKDRLGQQNQDIDLYLKSRQMDMDALREEVKPVAEERLKKTLVLLELSDAEKIQVNPDDLQSETTRTLEAMSRVLPEKEARRLSDRNAVSQLVGNIMMDMMTRQTLERIRAISSGEGLGEVEAEPADGGEDLAPTEESPAESEEPAPAEAGAANEPGPEPESQELPETE